MYTSNTHGVRNSRPTRKKAIIFVDWMFVALKSTRFSSQNIEAVAKSAA